MLEAIAEGEELRREELHLSELAIAQFASIHFNSKKTQPPYFSTKDFCLWRDKENNIEEDVRQTIFSLRAEELIPGWVTSWLPNEEIGKVDVNRGIPIQNDLVRKTRAWGSSKVFIICPEIVGNLAKARFLCVNGVSAGFHQVMDVDTGDKIMVYVSSLRSPLKQNSYVSWKLL